MDNFAEKKNAEGYSDPTAYQAIKNMVKPGEIWTKQKKGDYGEDEVLVVAFSDNVATVLHLMDEYKDGCIKVISEDVMWSNPRMLNWTWNGYLNRCVRKLSDQEFDQILAAIECVLAVEIGTKEADWVANPVPDPVASREMAAMKAELDSLRCRAKEADCVANKNFELLVRSEKETEKLKIQLEMMKDMYSDLMEKFLQKV